MNKKRIGYACLIGPTNAGKSTLLNSIFKKKISIVSHKVQTTNFAIEVVKYHKDNKIIFVDTPGLYNKKNNTNFLNDVNVEIKRSDVIVIILDISIHLFYEEILEKILKNTKKPKIFTLPVLIFFCALLIDINFNKSYFSKTLAQTFLLIREANLLSSCPSLSFGYKLINFLASTKPKTLSPKNSKISLFAVLSFEKLLCTKA